MDHYFFSSVSHNQFDVLSCETMSNNEFIAQPFMGKGPFDARVVSFMLFVQLSFPTWFHTSTGRQSLIQPMDPSVQNHLHLKRDYEGEVQKTKETKLLFLSMIGPSVRSVLEPILDDVSQQPCERLRLCQAYVFFIQTYTEDIVQIAACIEASGNETKSITTAAELEGLIAAVLHQQKQLRGCDKFHDDKTGRKVSWGSMQVNTFFLAHLQGEIYGKTREEITSLLQEKADDFQRHKGKICSFKSRYGADRAVPAEDSGEEEQQCNRLFQRWRSGGVGGVERLMASPSRFGPPPQLGFPAPPALALEEKLEAAEQVRQISRDSKMRKKRRQEEYDLGWEKLMREIPDEDDKGGIFQAAIIARKRMKVHYSQEASSTSSVSSSSIEARVLAACVSEAQVSVAMGFEDRIKQLEQRDRMQARRGRSRSEENEQSGSRGRGGGSGFVGGASRERDASQECHAFRDTGYCHFGDRCRYWHRREQRGRERSNSQDRGSNREDRQRSPTKQRRPDSPHPTRSTSSSPHPRSSSPYQPQGAGGKG